MDKKKFMNFNYRKNLKSGKPKPKNEIFDFPKPPEHLKVKEVKNKDKPKKHFFSSLFSKFKEQKVPAEKNKSKKVFEKPSQASKKKEPKIFGKPKLQVPKPPEEKPASQKNITKTSKAQKPDNPQSFFSKLIGKKKEVKEQKPSEKKLAIIKKGPEPIGQKPVPKKSFFSNFSGKQETKQKLPEKKFVWNKKDVMPPIINPSVLPSHFNTLPKKSSLTIKPEMIMEGQRLAKLSEELLHRPIIKPKQVDHIIKPAKPINQTMPKQIKPQTQVQKTKKMFKKPIVKVTQTKPKKDRPVIQNEGDKLSKEAEYLRKKLEGLYQS